MELIVDKKGADLDAFKTIRAELEQMRAQAATAGAKRPPPPPPPPGAKRPRTG